jgi:hypothetical protein
MKPNKPTRRNPVAQHAKKATSGGGAHKSKKAAVKRGDNPKHKKREEYMENLQYKLIREMNENLDDEGAMAKGQLKSVVKKAKALYRMLDDYDQLDGWVQSKLTIAADHIDTVYDFLRNNKQDSTGNYLSKK